MDHGRTGFVVPPGDGPALAEAVLAAAGEAGPEQVRNMGEEARKTVEQRSRLIQYRGSRKEIYERLGDPAGGWVSAGDSPGRSKNPICIEIAIVQGDGRWETERGGDSPHPTYIAQWIRLMALSIIIVNFNTEKLLKGCLESVYAGANGTLMSISVVDNNSHDGSVPMVKSHFPKVQIIENRQQSRRSQKPTTCVISQSALRLHPAAESRYADHRRRHRAGGKFMEQNPKVGIAGCKVLNRDGTLQLACRRSIPTPKVAFFRLTGLSKLFPRSKAMAAYNLTYTDPEQTHEVGAVSGAFLMIRKKVVDEIGLLDERFFMYGEELDWCLRAKRAGWLVMYHPDAQIVHYKGESAKSNSRKAAVGVLSRHVSVPSQTLREGPFLHHERPDLRRDLRQGFRLLATGPVFATGAVGLRTLLIGWSCATHAADRGTVPCLSPMPFL